MPLAPTVTDQWGVMRRATLNPLDKLLWLYLKDLQVEQGDPITLHVKRIVPSALGCSERQVWRSLNALEREGLIERRTPHRKHSVIFLRSPGSRARTMRRE